MRRLEEGEVGVSMHPLSQSCQYMYMKHFLTMNRNQNEVQHKIMSSENIQTIRRKLTEETEKDDSTHVTGEALLINL